MRWFYVWTQRKYPPILMKPVIEATVFGFKKIFQASQIKHGGNYWQNKMGDYFYVSQEMKNTVDKICIQALKNPKFLYNIFEIALTKAKKLKI